MTIAAIIRTVLFIFAGIALLMALRSLIAGMRSRSSVGKQYFNVGRLEAQRRVFANMLFTLGLVILALLLGIGASVIPDDMFGSETALGSSTDGNEQADAIVVEPEAVVEESESGAMSDLAEGVDEAAEPAEVEVVPTAIPTETPVPTPELATVYVNSPIVGLYIRDLPEGDIIDVLDDQTPLSLLDSSESLNGINWIQVRTADGREGWVAEQFTTSTLPLLSPDQGAADSES